jgi:hypothetical protein
VGLIAGMIHASCDANWHTTQLVSVINMQIVLESIFRGAFFFVEEWNTLDRVDRALGIVNWGLLLACLLLLNFALAGAYSVHNGE